VLTAPPGFPCEDAIAAWRAVGAFWRALADGRWAFLCIRTAGQPVIHDEPAIVSATHMWVVIGGPGGGWQMWGAPSPEGLEHHELVVLPILPNWGAFGGTD
jgi:hypothetical protein